ncbi:hypothetical protein ELY33_14865 [Vreelandella andesensis]|uniref:DUF4123 domain-containing protein n=1 Tax=Vreelandella andesensis TaxID=447567 RepID=A0A3S0XYV0_9GAMM|nr:hypothetical protein [Halomonas andesensis]RUR27869.1 hypothetical protein ELY33_14865 [Halomonas andesensis]
MSASQTSFIKTSTDVSTKQPTSHAPPGMTTGSVVTDLEALVKGLGVSYLVEPSAKFQPDQWRSDRCLLGIDVNTLTARQWQTRLPPVLKHLGMLGEGQQSFMHLLSAPDAEQKAAPHYLLIGLEGQTSKVYWEHSLAELRHHDPSTPLVLYSAWKWKAEHPALITDYVMAPDAQQANLLIQRELQKLPPVVEDLLEQLEIIAALKNTPWPPLTVDVIERAPSPSQAKESSTFDDRTQRCSINLHLHHFAPRLGDIAAPIFTLAREWLSAERDELRDWLAQYGDQMLSNVSLGVDQHAKPFMTFYYGGEVRTPSKR